MKELGRGALVPNYVEAICKKISMSNKVAKNIF